MDMSAVIEGVVDGGGGGGVVEKSDMKFLLDRLGICI